MIIFIDMDEVLADTYGAHIEQYNKDFNKQLSQEACMGGEVWQNVPKDHQVSVRKYVCKKGFFRALNPIKDSREVVKELSLKHEVYIASAAMQFPNSLIEKHHWLEAYFPFIPWQQRILCGDKHILRGDVLIDDRSYNLEHFKGRTLLFSSPHNVHTQGYERVDNWQQIAKKLL